jgi:hypothetical protein
MKLTYDSIRKAYADLGYSFGPFNIFGIRCAQYDTNTFNDLVGWMDNKGNWACYEATTDPGHAVKGSKVPEGTAIMKSGFYPKAYKLGVHKSNPKHPALQQVGKIMFYRVKNGKMFDASSVVNVIIGANVHSTRDGWTPTEVDNFSKGCQVIRRWVSHLRFLIACRKSGIKLFDYALFQEKEVSVV